MLALGLKRFSRSDRYGNRVQQKRSSLLPSLFSPGTKKSAKSSQKRQVGLRASQAIGSSIPGVGGGRSGKSSFESMSNSMGSNVFEDSSVISTKQKFAIFQKSMYENEHINQALRRRKFSMVMTLLSGLS